VSEPSESELDDDDDEVEAGGDGTAGLAAVELPAGDDRLVTLAVGGETFGAAAAACGGTVTASVQGAIMASASETPKGLPPGSSGMGLFGGSLLTN